jgi:hypothetical protein
MTNCIIHTVKHDVRRQSFLNRIIAIIVRKSVYKIYKTNA